MKHKKLTLGVLKKRYSTLSNLITDSECKFKLALNLFVYGTGLEIKEQYVFLKQEKELSYYIADFYLPWAKMVIEVDGGVHEHRENYDANRDNSILDSYNVITLRIKNEDIDDASALSEIFSGIISNYSKSRKKKVKYLRVLDKIKFRLINSDKYSSDVENIIEKAYEEMKSKFEYLDFIHNKSKELEENMILFSKNKTQFFKYLSGDFESSFFYNKRNR